MCYATYTQGNWGDSWFLMVGSQIGNLPPNPPFGHNLCFKYPNGLWEPILDIYVPRAFQWYKKPFNLMGFDMYNCFLKIWGPLGFQLPKWKLTWECGGSFSHTLPHSWEHEMWLLGFTFNLHLHKPLLWLRAQG